MKTLQQIAGTYTFKSPYHKNKKRLPFNIRSDGFVSTVEYKGWTPFLIRGFYKLETLLGLIESGYIKKVRRSFLNAKKDLFGNHNYFNTLN